MKLKPRKKDKGIALKAKNNSSGDATDDRLTNETMTLTNQSFRRFMKQNSKRK